ncbi:MAG: YfiR family protein [Bacteroidales bacterium]
MKRLLLSVFIILFITKFNYAQVQVSKAQAMFSYNFTKFFDWPQSEKQGDFVMGVLGNRSLASELEKVTAGKKNVTQPIVVKYFRNINDVEKCHVIFVDALKSEDISEIHSKTGTHCLIITDSNTGINKGAAIQFVTEGDRLKYDFKSENALKHGLKFHSKVKEMARNNY